MDDEERGRFTTLQSIVDAEELIRLVDEGSSALGPALANADRQTLASLALYANAAINLVVAAYRAAGNDASDHEMVRLLIRQWVTEQFSARPITEED